MLEKPLNAKEAPTFKAQLETLEVLGKKVYEALKVEGKGKINFEGKAAFVKLSVGLADKPLEGLLGIRKDEDTATEQVVLFIQTKEKTLNLVSCGYEWTAQDKGRDHWQKNLIA